MRQDVYGREISDATMGCLRTAVTVAVEMLRASGGGE